MHSSYSYAILNLCIFFKDTKEASGLCLSVQRLSICSRVCLSVEVSVCLSIRLAIHNTSELVVDKDSWRIEYRVLSKKTLVCIL